MKTKQRFVLSTGAGIVLSTFVFLPLQQALANTSGTDVVISQIQVATSGSGNADKEFVELYNPTNDSIPLDGWRLTRKSAAGTQTTLVSEISGSIAPHSYFLIAHPDFNSVTPDLTYSASSSAIANNNTVVLYSDAGNTVVDKVGYGDDETTISDVETAKFVGNPAADQSIVRKASATSTQQSLITGGTEAASGNGYDTDNNANDFLLLNAAQPRNAASQQTNTGTPTPTTSGTPSPTVTTTPTVSPTDTPTPTATTTASPTPTSSATPTPTGTTSPTPTMTTTPTETITPTATGTVTPTETLTATPTEEPSGHDQHSHWWKNHHHMPHYRLHWKWEKKEIKIFHKEISIPKLSCSIDRHR